MHNMGGRNRELKPSQINTVPNGISWIKVEILLYRNRSTLSFSHAYKLKLCVVVEILQSGEV